MSFDRNNATGGTALQDVIDSARESCVVAADYLRQKKDEFIEVTQSRLEVLDHELTRLDHQARDTSEGIRSRWKETRSELNRRRRMVWQQFRGLQNRASDGWSELARGIDHSRQELSAAIARARDHFKLPR